MPTSATLDVVNKAELGNKGLVITIDGDVKGHLMVGKATLTWFEKNAKKQGYKVNWSDFEAWMKSKSKVSATRP